MLHKNKTWLLTCFIAAALILTIIIALEVSKEHRAFRRYVFKPIPSSVKDIKADLPWQYTGHKYVLYFKINESDLALILNSRSFKEFEGIVYTNGRLYWGYVGNPRLDPRQNPFKGDFTGHLLLDVPGSGRRPVPEWFAPNKWNKPKVYSFRERWGKSDRERKQVLIYNEGLAEAYLIEYLPGAL
jgi:hypothetical protein